MCKNETIIDFKNIYASYGDADVLKNINLNIDKNEHTVILGANGSGKSTLIKLFSNDIYPRILPNSYKKIFNKETWNIFDLKRFLGIITNDMSDKIITLAPYITVFDAIISSLHSAIGMQSHHEYTHDDKYNTQKILEQLGILHLQNKNVCELSTGQLRKTVIARALIHNPMALLLDEPTTGLDIKARFEFLKLVSELSKTKTIILITHHIEEIIPQIKNVVLIKNGEIVKSGLKQEIINSDNLSNIFDANIVVVQDKDMFYIKSIS